MDYSYDLTEGSAKENKKNTLCSGEMRELRHKDDQIEFRTVLMKSEIQWTEYNNKLVDLGGEGIPFSEKNSSSASFDWKWLLIEHIKIFETMR